MSAFDRPGANLTPRQARVVKLSTAIIAAVLLVLIVAVGELFLLRATGRAQVRQLACYMVRYAPDSDQTAKDIRGAYGCPPPRTLPTLKPGPQRSSAGASASSPGMSPPLPSASPAGNRSPVVAPDPTAGKPRQVPSAAPVPSAPSASASPSSSTSAPAGILGGLLCDPAGLRVCVR